MADERVMVNGTTLRTRIEGRENAPWVVLVHSLGTDLRLWDAQAAVLAPHFRILRYDTRGHGQSAAPQGPYSIDMLSDDLLGLLSHYLIARAQLVGISLGAVTTMAVAARRTETFTRVMVCNTRSDVPPEMAKAIDERNALIREKGIAAIAEAQPLRWLSPANAGNATLIERVRDMLKGASAAGFMACADAVKTSDLDRKLPQINVPALFVAADQDGGLPIQVMRRMQGLVPGAELAEIKGAGHLSNLDQPDAFNALLLKFLDRAT